MATLILSISTCAYRMTSGERRLAQRLEDKLDDDYLLWYDVPMGPKNAHPDFCVMHPRRGILVLEIKDWKLPTIQQADKQTWEIIPDGIPKSVINPLEQARQYAHQVVNALERDPQLVQADGPHAGKLAFPWSYGVGRDCSNNSRQHQLRRQGPPPTLSGQFKTHCSIVHARKFHGNASS